MQKIGNAIISADPQEADGLDVTGTNIMFLPLGNYLSKLNTMGGCIMHLHHAYSIFYIRTGT